MNGIVYHGSEKGNITELKKRKSTHLKECVYATDSIVVALLFMGKGNGDLDTCIGTDDDKLYIVERRDGVLEKLYNKCGYLYELDGTNFEHFDYLWNREVISFHDEKVLKCSGIDNILEALEDKEKLKEIVIYRYPNRPSHIPLDNSDLIDKYKKFEEDGLGGSIEQLLRIYPEFSDLVNR